MYGYTLRDHDLPQCLIYEYAANGSLDNFLKGDTNRACLPSYIRLSIMLDMTKAVHFLHTGGCKGYALYHRDIKSANICLSGDFTAQLIDCGLAKLVPIDGSPSTTTSIANCQSLGATFGTPGYICPEYINKKANGFNYEYQPACDVYSMGVVMVELISGCLISDWSSRNGCNNFRQKYVEDEDCRLILDGWKLLKSDADPCISWKPDVLDCVCKAAISCLKTSTKNRSSTQNLLQMLTEAFHLNAGTGIRQQTFEPNSGNLKCDVCNQSLSSYQKTEKCSEGHLLCQECMESTILRNLPRGLKTHCPFVSCTSREFSDKDLYGLVSYEVFMAYEENQRTLHNMELKLNELISETKRLKSDFNHHTLENAKNFRLLTEELKKFDTLASGMDRALYLLALLGAQHIKQCPNLVWIYPAANQSDWLKGITHNKFFVSFICAHSGEICHQPFEINVSKKWIVKVAPFVKLCLHALRGMMIYGQVLLPFPYPANSLQHQFLMMESYLDRFINKGKVMYGSQIEKGTITIGSYTQIQELCGDAFAMIADEAKKEDRFWNGKLVPVCEKYKGIIWVKPIYESLYYIG